MQENTLLHSLFILFLFPNSPDTVAGFRAKPSLSLKKERQKLLHASVIGNALRRSATTTQSVGAQVPNDLEH